MIKSSRAALAEHIGSDISELPPAYQPGLYTKTVYAFDDCYMCATKDSKKLPKPLTKTRGSEFNWSEVKDEYVNSYGWKIFTAPIE